MQFDSTNIVFIDSRNSYMYNIIMRVCPYPIYTSV